MRGRGSRSRAKGRRGATLGMLLATVALLHTPLPQADFHNIRHHDAPGEVCEHHHHLLRWHPGAGTASDVAVLHWHWFLIRPDGSDPSPEGDGLALHAHTPEPYAPLWDEPPSLGPDTSLRQVLKPGEAPSFQADAAMAPGISALALGPPGCGRRGSPTPLARGQALTSLLQRWVC